MERCYLIIDLKSYYASCECVARGLPATRRERNEQIGGHKRGSEDATKVQPRENISVV